MPYPRVMWVITAYNEQCGECGGLIKERTPAMRVEVNKDKFIYFHVYCFGELEAKKLK